MFFNVGDIVFLLSGGPAMTIYKIGVHDQVYCCWFKPDGTLQVASFVHTILCKDESSEVKQ